MIEFVIELLTEIVDMGYGPALTFVCCILVAWLLVLFVLGCTTGGRG